MATKVVDKDQFEYISVNGNNLSEGITIMQKTYFVEEGVSKGVKLNKSIQALEEISDLLSVVADDGVSIVALDKNTNEVAGVSFNKLHVNPGSETTFLAKYMDKCKNSSSKMWIKVMNDAATNRNLYTTCNTDCLFEVFCVAVLPEYRGKGIARKLFNHSIDIARYLMDPEGTPLSSNFHLPPTHLKPKAVITVVTALATQHISQTLEFSTAVAINYSTLMFENVSFDTVVGTTPKYIKVKYLLL